MKEILIIAPTREMYKRAMSIIEVECYDNISVEYGTLKDSLPIAEEGIKEGARVIVSRGGTYNMLNSLYKVPVVEIKVDAYDIIESYKEVKNCDEPLGIIGFNNVIYGFDILEEILNNNITTITLEKEDDVYAAIEKYRKKGITTYIGDTTVAHIIEKLNCRGILIESRKENILRAIKEAIQIINATKIEQERRVRIETMTDFVHDGIITVDKNFKVTVFNKSAEEIFGIKKADALYRDITDLIPNTELPKVVESKKPQFGQIQSIRNNKILTNRVPIILNNEVQGAVATFQDTREISSFDHKIRRSLLNKGFSTRFTFDDIVHDSSEINKCIEIAKKYSEYNTPVTITGESGVGKELFCQSIHKHSARSNKPFVAVNCAAIPESLIESEFFGYEEGAFTGARKKGKPGVFELAHQGTIFLDEISEIPIKLQGRLLRVLQEKQVVRIGGDKVIPIDVKIICATNKDLKVMVKEGTFRRDLFYRINVLTLFIPPLRERKKDIIKLTEFFVDKYSNKYNKNKLKLSEVVKAKLCQINFEGNIRELEGMVEKAVILDSFDLILKEYDDISYMCEDNRKSMKEESSNDLLLVDNTINSIPDNVDLRTVERMYIEKVYRETGENTTKTCDILKITRSTLWRKLKEISN
nr:sigma 54-interacting transcriptional regulator [Clostridioides sp.]